jgi:hypothetical protein
MNTPFKNSNATPFGTMIFSQIKRYPFHTTPNMERKVTKSVNTYNMIGQIQNIKPCGKCSGAK